MEEKIATARRVRSEPMPGDADDEAMVYVFVDLCEMPEWIEILALAVETQKQVRELIVVAYEFITASSYLGQIH